MAKRVDSGSSLVNGDSATVLSIQDRGLNYGDGLFETIAIVDGKPLLWDAHIARLAKGCEQLQIPFDDYAVLADEAQLLSNAKKRAVLKIIVTRGVAGRGYRSAKHSKPNRIITVFSWPEHPVEYLTSGVALKFCQARYGHNMQLAGIKHLNRLEQVLASNEINDNAIAEGVVLDQDGKVIEGTMTNIFLKIGHKILTPDVSQCGVAGVIRQYILQQGSLFGLKIQCTEVSIEQLFSASAVFLCNSIIGVWPVKKIAEQCYLDLSLGQQIAAFLTDQHVIAPH